MLSYKGNNYTSSPKDLGTIKEKDTERPWEPEVGSIWREVVLSGHGKTRILFFPSACGCIHTTCARVSQLKLQHGWGGLPEAPSLTKKLLAADGRPERDESFCSGMWLPRVHLVSGAEPFVSASLPSALATPGAPGDCPFPPPISTGL